MGCSSYDHAVSLAGTGPTTVINHPDTLMVWCTPLERISPDLRTEPLDPDRAQRARFVVNYAVRCAALGTRGGDSLGRA